MSMGLFDLPSPLFTWLNDQLLGLLPIWLQLTLWGMLAALLSMLLYKWVSRQGAMAGIKQEIKSKQAEMASFDGEISELLPLIGSTLKLALKQFGMALGPALLASVPLIFLLVWLSNHFGHQLPAAGESVTVQVSPAASSGIRVQPVDAVKSHENGVWQLQWPGQGQTVTLYQQQTSLLQLPMASSTSVIHKRQWWNALIANPLGYLPAESPVDSIKIQLPAVQVTTLGPEWIQGWLVIFFVVVIIFSLVLKYALRIE